MSLMVDLSVIDCILETRYDKFGRTCLAIHASAATTDLKHVFSPASHSDDALGSAEIDMGLIFSVLSLAVTSML